MGMNPQVYLMKPENFQEMLRWERFAKQLKEIVKAIYLSTADKQIDGVLAGTIR